MLKVPKKNYDYCIKCKKYKEVLDNLFCVPCYDNIVLGIFTYDDKDLPF